MEDQIYIVIAMTPKYSEATNQLIKMLTEDHGLSCEKVALFFQTIEFVRQRNFDIAQAAGAITTLILDGEMAELDEITLPSRLELELG
jgi:hypothetical protein